MDWHGYFGLENISLTEAQKGVLVAGLRQLGPARHPQPACLCHWRARLDGDAAIFEALFNEQALTIQRWKQRLGAIFGVDPETIDHAVMLLSFADGETPAVTFSRGGTDRIRVALFGGVGCDWDQSRRETLGYLALHRAEWESEEAI